MIFNLIDDTQKPASGTMDEGSQTLKSSLQQELSQQPLALIPLADVQPDPTQPRKSFDEETLLDLAQSIEENGLLQPIVVLPADNTGKYRLIMGERRWRAHSFTNRDLIPAIIRPATDSTVLALQIIENNQREDIAPLEEARAIERLVELSGSKKEVAQALGRSPSWLSKRLALLNTPEEIQSFAQEHAVKDINTLNSLSKLHEENPEAAAALMQEVRVNGSEGGLRSKVESARQEAAPNTKKPQQQTQIQDEYPKTTPARHKRENSLTQRLKNTPLSNLPGLESLSLSLMELEESFSQFINAGHSETDFDAAWQAFVQQVDQPIN